MARGIIRKVERAADRADKEVAGNASRGGLYAPGLAAEGYAGGYRDALYDVLLVLRGGQPNRSYWRNEQDE